MRKKALAALPLLTTKKKKIAFCAQVDGDTLVLDCWKDRTKYIGRYCLRKDGEYMALQGGVWRQKKLMDLLLERQNSYWRCGRAGAVCNTESETAVCEKFLTGNGLCEMVYDDIESNINIAEACYLAEKRAAALERKWRRINEDIMAEVPPLPEGLDGWTRRVVFGGEQHLYPAEGEGKDAYACTACGRVHRMKDAKHGRIYRCEQTGAEVQLDKVHGDKTRHAYAMVLQRLDGGRCIARHLKLVSHWHGSAQDIFIYERCRLFLGGSGLIGMYHGQRMDADEFEQEWFDRNPVNQNPMRGFCYPDGVREALAGTPYAHLGIAEMAEKGWRVHYNNIMYGHSENGVFEYLAKGGYKRFCEETGGWWGGIHSDGGDGLVGALGINMQRAHRLRQADGGVVYLLWMQWEEQGGKRIPEATVRFLEENMIEPRNVKFALSYMSPEQIGNYLQRQKKETGDSIREILGLWADTVRMAEELKLCVSDAILHRPRDLRLQHDRLVAKMNEAAAAEKEQEYAAKWPQLPEIVAGLSKYAFADKEYCIVPPRRIMDVIIEGRTLQHCVANERYFERMARDESYILFLRRAATPDVPWYTLEVEPGGTVRQKRTSFNRQNADLDAALPFIRKWQAYVKRTISERERGLATASAQKRREEIAALKRDKVVVHGAAENGRLLADVLLADLMEGA